MREPQFWQTVRENIIGRYAEIKTPFGKRLLTYTDYTASGRAVQFIEDYLSEIMELYGNTHTEDTSTGITTTERLMSAEKIIKKHVNADDRYKIIHEGYGSTGAIHRLQKILGIYVPPVLRENIKYIVDGYFGENKKQLKELNNYMEQNKPVVLVGPYEHHSNELTWREGFCRVVEIELTPQGLIDLKDLENKLNSYKNGKRPLIGSFSACSNVTGIKSPVYEIAGLIHDHGAYAFFDFSASAPYIEIDIRHDERSYFDAIFFSPHKFLGGPGSPGILIIHEKLYRKDLPPTFSGGGTVDYVGFTTQLYSRDIEIREKPGTPGIIQMMKAALAVELKEKLGTELIEKREQELTERAIDFLSGLPNVEILGNPDPSKRIGIISFNISLNGGYFHPRFIVRLLNDLFGIQARAGCSCAGPYGHRLLHIDYEKSRKYKRLIQEGLTGLKPGWARISLHYLMDDEEFDFIMKAVRFVSENAVYFLPLYEFNIHTGRWQYRGFYDKRASFGIDYNISNKSGRFKKNRRQIDIKSCYHDYLKKANKIAEELKSRFSDINIKETEDDLIRFVYYQSPCSFF